MKRAQILETAKNYIMHDRNKEAGEPEDNFKTIADFWNTYLDAKEKAGFTRKIYPHDTAVMVGLIKTARIATSPKKEDHWVDQAGYAACGGECAEKFQPEGCHVSELLGPPPMLAECPDEIGPPIDFYPSK